MATRQIVRIVGILIASFGVSLGLRGIARAERDTVASKAQVLACQACHVTDATKGEPPPHLAGQRASYLAKQLKAFRAGDRKNRVMNPITRDLTDTDIENLAAYWSAQPVGSDTTVPPEVLAIKQSKMEFPRDFPGGFVFYGNINKEEERIVAKAYVNKVGFQAARAGKRLPEGSVVILAIYPATFDASNKPIVDKDGNWVIGELRQYHGMEARAGWGTHIPEMLRNANWNYALFTPEKTRRTEINQAGCLSCHLPAASTGFVYGLKTIQAKAAAK